MDNQALESGASATPPTAPASPSMGYPTKGNPGTGTPASKGGVFWHYQIGEELRAVIVAAGLTPSTSVLTQLRDALRSAGLFQTPAQFDSSTKAATTAFVQGVGLHSNGVNGTAANYVMTAADIGRFYYSVGINANITLPPILSVPSGSIVNILNINGSPCVISGNANIYAVGAVATSITIGQWENLTLVSNGATWFQMAGSSGLGVGQSWLNVLAGRVLGTTYTNASGKPITVNVSVTMVNPNTLITVSIGGSGLTVSTGSVAGYVTGGNFIVPPGVTYVVTAVGTLTSWLELR